MPTRSSLRLALSTLAAAALLAGCGAWPSGSQSGTAAPTPAPTPAATSGSPAAAVHWGYTGEDGPAHWGQLPGAEACGIGGAQSPIDLAGATEGELSKIGISYEPSSLVVTNTGHAMQAVYDPGSFATINGQRFDLKQIHQHTPSEHTVDGAHAAAELHFVHANSQGSLAVLGVLVAKGSANAALEEVIDAAPDEVGATAAPSKAKLDANELLPKERTSYRYDGSLTTPPCSEGVNWIVFSVPITASAAELAELARLSGKNNRPVQDLDGRTILTDVPG